MSGALLWILDAGVRVLPQRDWEERERELYRSLHGHSMQIEAGGRLVLPRLPGRTLATLLESPATDDVARRRAIELAVAALAGFHRRGFTHADAMAENVLVDLETDVAHWFDFETIHEAVRPAAWRRADDLRTLLSTCLLRTEPGRFGETLRLILDTYGEEEVTGLLEADFRTAWRRPLIVHLSQAALSYRSFREIARLLRERHGR
jgi:hypothetical protein